jgi:hypothetical protein
MTIRNRELNNRLSNLEACAEHAPEGTYERAKAVAETIGAIATAILHEFRGQGFKAFGDDRLRDIEAALYGYLLECNPGESELITAEGFGETMNGPARAHVIRQTIRDRDAFAALRGGA